jgi:hypothetical protein
MQIDESEEHEASADASIDESCGPNANVTVERDAHRQKQQLPNFSTEEGMQIDESDEQSENADSPIEQSRQPDSKITFEIV